MPAGHLKRGSAGEDAAAAFLRKKGYRILDRNWRAGKAELDIVCERKKTVVFAEVKTRAADGMAAPHDAVTPAKRRHLSRAAAQWLTKHDAWDRPCRFDLVAVLMGEGGVTSVEHVENAFELTPGSGGEGGWQPW